MPINKPSRESKPVPALDSKLRSQLDDVCQKARDLAVAYAQSALQKRAVDAAEPLSHFGPKDKELRNRLRARGRQVGDLRSADGTQSIDQLAQELAYEYWHRMLFARFLAENNLLMHPDGVAVSLEECEELAATAEPQAANGFVLAARYASTMLPQIFRTDDVLLEIEFAPEQRLGLEKLLAGVPRQTFEADDSLGWVYQFWQTAEKKRVNDTGDKIDGRTLPAVTQLFTEHYMVEFLLHNTIGAWWCARQGIQGPPGDAGVPAGMSPVDMPYLRWQEDGTPAAGKFEGWPKTLAEFSMLDPSTGSGHFLVAAFNLLVPLRMRDEGLTAGQACEAVLRDNLFGLELDPRCTQIAAFALALAAWKYPDEADQPLGYRPLPPINIACSGQGVSGRREEWLTLASDDARLRDGMEKLYDLFRQAPHLGSLIDPRREAGDMFMAGFQELRPLIEKALRAENKEMTADSRAVGVAAQGIAKAASYLGKRFTLVATNVPYLSRQKHNDTLRDYCDANYEAGKADLATAFVQRCMNACTDGGSISLVTPHNWLFLGSYKSLREQLLRSATWNLVARLGPGAFETITGEVVNVALPVITRRTPSASAGNSAVFSYIDVSSLSTPQQKQVGMVAGKATALVQRSQLSNPDCVISPDTRLASLKKLGEYATVYQGISTTDGSRFVVRFWELPQQSKEWERFQLAADLGLYSGLHGLIYWQQGKGVLSTIGTAKKGREAWGKDGFGISVTGALYVSRYLGTPFDGTLAVVVPKTSANVEAIGRYLTSEQFVSDVRSVDQALSVTESSFAKVPFDLAYWQGVSAKEGSLQSPTSDDPTQWLFKGDISTSADTFQVAVARLLGYHWPEQPKAPDPIDSLADSDGILCLPGVRGEAAAAERLLEVLHAAFGKNWSDSVLHKLLTDAGCKAGTTLDDWLRNHFFEQHCKRFHNRPFIWQVWDGRKDGFAALVNYPKLSHKALENLTYSYLGDWITAQGKSDKAGADSRLGAAQELQAKLKLILTGEPPYDIFVRWKPLHEQAVGWNPDLNDGVRMNIRPFIEAGILRKNPNIKWTKDRGKEPDREKVDYPWFWSGKEFVGDRVNDIHLTNAEKQAARTRKKGAK